MDTRTELREFLTTRRDRVTPDQVGLPTYGTRRRVSGLRREEVALLAGISVEYYTRLERGNPGGVSDDVLDSVARALQLDDAERAHLDDLVRAAKDDRPPRRRRTPRRVRPGVQQVLDAMTGAAAYVRNGRLDVLAANTLGRALLADVYDSPAQPPNLARFNFLDPRAPAFYRDFEAASDDCVALLRAEAGRDPHDDELTGLVGELSTRSDDFRVRWANHDVKFHRTGNKALHHPLVGDLDLGYEALELPGDPGQSLIVYTAAPNTPTRQALDLLASWASPPAPGDADAAARAEDTTNDPADRR
ncbi:MAG: helix-turn-helix transcriptional regulator [Actinomycetota bacterium]|nr:helix-turn-helix transcriptional regulator [Actinomycetota bacterium]